jgi:hypothetical protein
MFSLDMMKKILFSMFQKLLYQQILRLVTNKQLLRTAPIHHCPGSAPSMHIFIYLLCDVFCPTYLLANLHSSIASAFS